jgi:circadian clock protein KaiC
MQTDQIPYQINPVPISKSRTGIIGFDEITDGGLPARRTTVFLGGAGSGKTLFGLQFLVNGARFYNEPGIFIAFEQNAHQIRCNAATFGWDLVNLEIDDLFYLDARPLALTGQTSGSGLDGLLDRIAAKAKAIDAKRIVFDALDLWLFTLRDPAHERMEIHRVHEWLQANELTGILTFNEPLAREHLGGHYWYVSHLADAVVHLHHELVDRVAVRHVRVAKFLGSAFADNKFPLVFGLAGIEVGGLGHTQKFLKAPTEKISTGVAGLDSMLGGGYFRGSGILVSGSPGTAKSTLAAAFAKACCDRGEAGLFLSFDEWSDEMVRNMQSVGIHLAPFVENGLLRVVTALSESKNAEEHLLDIRNHLIDRKMRFLVIDPMSAMLKSGGDEVAVVAVHRLVHLTKSLGVTLFLTSLLTGPDTSMEETPLRISTLADTWIHSSYLISAGERNRALTVVKSRGSKHSNQVREFTLSEDGITLSDVYTAQGQVLMGTARWQKEEDERLESEKAELELERRKRLLAIRQAESKARLEILKQEIEAQELESSLLEKEGTSRNEGVLHQVKKLRELRDGD